MTPFSTSTVQFVGVPSSSIESEPRRPASVPSSTTVTPGAATFSPSMPANADVPLRLKSPSKPWPIASCSSTPGQPGPSTTVMLPAGASTDSRLTSATRTASRAAGVDELAEAEASAAAGAAGFAAAVLLGDDLHVDAHERPHVGGERAVGRGEQHGFEARGDARDDLLHARIERAAERIELA